VGTQENNNDDLLCIKWNNSLSKIRNGRLKETKECTHRKAAIMLGDVSLVTNHW